MNIYIVGLLILYRKKIVKFLIEKTDNVENIIAGDWLKGLNVSLAINFLYELREEIPSVTIQNCFAHSNVGESNSIEVVDELQFSNDIGLLPEDLLIEENLNTHDNTLDDI